MSDLLKRIDAAMERVKNGMGNMRIPADKTDPDLVLADCRAEIERLTRQLEAAEAFLECISQQLKAAELVLKKYVGYSVPFGDFDAHNYFTSKDSQ